MKRSLLMFASILLILSLVLSFGISGCSTEETSTTAAAPTTTTPAPTTTTPAPTTTTPAPTTTTPPPTTTTPPPTTTTPPPATTTTPPPETTTPPPETTTTTPAGTTVYVSVSVDGVLLVAAQPVTITNLTAEGAVKAAHEAFYSGGLSGYTAGINPTWNMYLVTQCWGVQNTPYIVINGAPLGAVPGTPNTVNAAMVAANDNILICTGADTSTISPVSLTATRSGDSMTVTATAWTLNFATFAYTHVLLANANVIDPVTGASLGTTDANGQITVTVPESGVVAIEGRAAINVNSATTT